MTSDAWILRWTRPRADWNPHKQNPRQALPKQDLPGVPDTAVVTPIGDGLIAARFFICKNQSRWRIYRSLRRFSKVKICWRTVWT